MTTLGQINSLFPPAFVGFDRILDDINRFARSSNDTYPPYNIVKTDEDHFSIEMAVAGFSRDELNIELKEQNLIISGDKNDVEREYLHKGISARKFNRSFRLADNVEVRGADFVDGMLVIQLERYVPEEKRARTIPIGYDKGETFEQELLVEDKVAA